MVFEMGHLDANIFGSQNINLMYKNVLYYKIIGYRNLERIREGFKWEKSHK